GGLTGGTVPRWFLLSPGRQALRPYSMCFQNLAVYLKRQGRQGPGWWSHPGFMVPVQITRPLAVRRPVAELSARRRLVQCSPAQANGQTGRARAGPANLMACMTWI